MRALGLDVESCLLDIRLSFSPNFPYSPPLCSELQGTLMCVDAGQNEALEEGVL